MKARAALVFLMLLVGCATAPVVEQRADSLFNDPAFAASSERISADQVFALSDKMKTFLRTKISPQMRSKDGQQALFDALYSKGELQLDYDATMTLNASEAFEARTGNCLSLVMLTGAFAKALGLSVHYQKVYIDDAWSRSHGLEFVQSHVNVTLGEKPSQGQTRSVGGHEMTVDFLRPELLKGRRTRGIGEQTIIAMYLSNRAAEALSLRQVDNAYWWARAAMVADPHYLPAYNTLGVIYIWHKNPGEAERVFNYILAVEPDNIIALSNLVPVLNTLGRTTEARNLADKLKKIRPVPPFYFLDQGLEAMKQKQFLTARDLFKKEIGRDAYYDKSHFWLAAAYRELGDVKNARKHLAIALENSTTRIDRELYAEKLAGLGAERL